MPRVLTQHPPSPTVTCVSDLPTGLTCVALGVRLLDPLALLLTEALTLAVCVQRMGSDGEE